HDLAGHNRVDGQERGDWRHLQHPLHSRSGRRASTSRVHVRDALREGSSGVNDSVRKLDQLLTRQLPKELHDLAVEELNKQAEKLRQAIAAAAPVHEGTLRTTVKTVPGKKDTT